MSWRPLREGFVLYWVDGSWFVSYGAAVARRRERVAARAPRVWMRGLHLGRGWLDMYSARSIEGGVRVFVNTERAFRDMDELFGYAFPSGEDPTN